MSSSSPLSHLSLSWAAHSLPSSWPHRCAARPAVRSLHGAPPLASHRFASRRFLRRPGDAVNGPAILRQRGAGLVRDARNEAGCRGAAEPRRGSHPSSQQRGDRSAAEAAPPLCGKAGGLTTCAPKGTRRCSPCRWRCPRKTPAWLGNQSPGPARTSQEKIRSSLKDSKRHAGRASYGLAARTLACGWVQGTQ